MNVTRMLCLALMIGLVGCAASLTDKDDRSRERALTRVTDQHVLYYFSMKDPSYNVNVRAASLLEDPTLLEAVATSGIYDAVRHAALQKLSSRTSFMYVATHTTHTNAWLSALVQLAKLGDHKPIVDAVLYSGCGFTEPGNNTDYTPCILDTRKSKRDFQVICAAIEVLTEPSILRELMDTAQQELSPSRVRRKRLSPLRVSLLVELAQLQLLVHEPESEALALSLQIECTETDKTYYRTDGWIMNGYRITSDGPDSGTTFTSEQVLVRVRQGGPTGKVFAANVWGPSLPETVRRKVYRGHSPFDSSVDSPEDGFPITIDVQPIVAEVRKFISAQSK